MVSRQLAAQGIRDERVLAAMSRVPRHRFVPTDQIDEAYRDSPLPIGHGQTISQPYVVAYMSELLGLQPRSRVLEVGTGSGYQTAVLAELAGEVWSVEIVPELAAASARLLEELGWRNVHVRQADGHAGWAEQAPFDAVIVTAAPVSIPPRLVEQLATPGRLVVPVGSDRQDIVLVSKTVEGLVERRLLPVRFVPMTGESAAVPGRRPPA